MNSRKEIPVLLLTGYLGSGKTTLLNKILANQKGIKFAVIVNDIGEVNIDAALIEQGGVVGKKDDSLVALQNGCICCTLKMDLVEQLKEIVDMQKFDYIVIEASGICEPAPIAQTICSIPTLGPQYIKNGVLRLDSIVTVVDALRMKDEFAGGDDLMKDNIDEEDLASLVIQQIEFCNIILLNKAAEVEPKDLDKLKHIIKAIQPKAEIFECNYGDVDLDKIVNTRKFDWETVATSAGWIQEIEAERNEDHHKHDDHDDDDHDDEHEHHHHDHDDEHEHEEHEHHHHDHDHHHHHHHDDEGEAEEYGIGTFVYYSRKPFDLGLFDDFVYSFTKNRRFQLERIAFPLSFTQDGTETKIESKDWKFTPLFTKGGVYTLIFDNLKAISAEKDTAVKHVVVENVYLSRDRVKQYVFDRLRGRWFLTAINEHAMADNVNSDFYRFYHRFSRSLQFQLAHIADPFAFKTYDSDNFQTIEGVLDAAQWPDYRPELPKGTVTNINYGQAYGNARRRVLMICSQSGGMGCSLVFVRKGSTWMLESLEN